MSYADDYLRQHEQQPEPNAPEFVEEKSEFFELRGWEIAAATIGVFVVGIAAAVYVPRAYDWLKDMRWAAAHRSDVERYNARTDDNACREGAPFKGITMLYKTNPPALSPNGAWSMSNGTTAWHVSCDDLLRLFREEMAKRDSGRIALAERMQNGMRNTEEKSR